jgi:hypothetical protein
MKKKHNNLSSKEPFDWNKFIADLVDSPATKEMTLRKSINLVIGGHLYDDGDIEKIPEILEEMADRYREAIKKLSE